jgi:MoxR-like ATPase
MGQELEKEKTMSEQLYKSRGEKAAAASERATRLAGAPESVVVFGPQGCGKTLHAEALRRHFGLVEVWDAGEDYGKPVEPRGVLVLCTDPAFLPLTARRTLRRVSFHQAAAEAGIPGFRH